MPVDRRPGALRALVLGLVRVVVAGAVTGAPDGARADEPAEGETVAVCRPAAAPSTSRESFQRGVITWTPRPGRPAVTTVRTIRR